MGKITKMHYIMFSFILAGLLFSGYLAGVKFFSDTCAFGANCPLFLGYPACYTGFIVYSILSIVSILALLKKELTRTLLLIVTGVSLFGVLFSGKLTFQEMQVWFDSGFIPFMKSLPLCSIGLIFFTVIFGLSIYLGKKEDEIVTLKSAEPKEGDIKDEITTTNIKSEEISTKEDVEVRASTIIQGSAIIEPQAENVKVKEVNPEIIKTFESEKEDNNVELDSFTTASHVVLEPSDETK